MCHGQLVACSVTWHQHCAGSPNQPISLDQKCWRVFLKIPSQAKIWESSNWAKYIWSVRPMFSKLREALWTVGEVVLRTGFRLPLFPEILSAAAGVVASAVLMCETAEYKCWGTVFLLYFVSFICFLFCLSVLVCLSFFSVRFFFFLVSFFHSVWDSGIQVLGNGLHTLHSHPTLGKPQVFF